MDERHILELNSNLLKPENVAWINKIGSDYFSYVLRLYEKDQLSEKDQIELLIIISDLLPYLSGSCWEEIGYEICKKIKYQLEHDGVNPWMLGMFYQLGKETFAAKLYHARTGHLEKFSNALFQELLREGAKKARQYVKRESNNAYAKEFDIICGISGILSYCLDYEVQGFERAYLADMAKYLEYMTEDYAYKNGQLIRFHIPVDHLNTDVEMKMFPTGYINLSLSHGMMGPYIALGRARREKVYKADDAIYKLRRIYQHFSFYHNGVVHWPSYISPDNYQTGMLPERKALMPFQRSSWCYGNISIVRSLQRIAAFDGNKAEEKIRIDQLCDIIKGPVENYNLTLPCLCHGYASVLAVGGYLYDDCKDVELMKALERLVMIMKKLFNGIEMDQIISEHFDGSIAILQGMGGTILALSKLMADDLEFGKLLAID